MGRAFRLCDKCCTQVSPRSILSSGWVPGIVSPTPRTGSHDVKVCAMEHPLCFRRKRGSHNPSSPPNNNNTPHPTSLGQLGERLVLVAGIAAHGQPRIPYIGIASAAERTPTTQWKRLDNRSFQADQQFRLSPHRQRHGASTLKGGHIPSMIENTWGLDEPGSRFLSRPHTAVLRSGSAQDSASVCSVWGRAGGGGGGGDTQGGPASCWRLPGCLGCTATRRTWSTYP